MKVISRNLWIVLAVVLLIALFAAIQVTAAPAAQTATPAPTKPAPVVDTAAPTVPGLKEWQGSGHADANELMQWLRGFHKPPRHTYVVHGEPQASDTLRLRIADELGWRVSVPEHLSTVTP